MVWIVLHQCCFDKKEIQMFPFVKGFKSPGGNIHTSMPGRGEPVLFSSLGGDGNTGFVSFRRSRLLLPGFGSRAACKRRAMGQYPGAHPGRRRRAGRLPRRTPGTARGGCCRAGAPAGLRYVGHLGTARRPVRRGGRARACGPSR